MEDFSPISEKTPLEIINNLVESQDHERLKEYLATLHPADIADIMDELPANYAVVIFEYLPTLVASEVLDETGSLVRQELVEKVDDERLADLLDELPMDDAAEFLFDLPPDTAIRLLDLMEPEEAQEVKDLLQYEDETAGRIMTRDVAALRRHWTAEEALNYLRSIADEEKAETVHYLYVVDREQHLIGVVPIRRLLLSRPETLIESIMSPDVMSVTSSADQEEIAEIVSKYDFTAVPVVDSENRLVGIVTVDDILDIIEEEATEDIQRLGGSEPLAQPYFSASPAQVIGKRLIWLLPLFVLSGATDLVIDHYEYVLDVFVTLTIFIPVVSATAGNAGSQTVATIIRAIAVGEIRIADIARTWLREASVGLALGLTLALFGYFRAVVFKAQTGVPLVLAITIAIVVVYATSVATLVPLITERLKIDPAVVSAPLITTIVDASALLIYLSLASFLLF